ncbi:hypothetical protein ACN2MM_04855 [Alkalilimnicola ehrlichii MLHE-1]|nr:hypothetical protein [Alkalilimnicola ehrlichii]
MQHRRRRDLGIELMLDAPEGFTSDFTGPAAEMTASSRYPCRTRMSAEQDSVFRRAAGHALVFVLPVGHPEAPTSPSSVWSRPQSG